MKYLARICFSILIIFISALFLPRIYDALFIEGVEKTHLFYSPVTQDFIYKEKTVIPRPDAVVEDHHAELTYATADGRFVDRLEFERYLPFIFYKNMEIRGMLPLELIGPHGQIHSYSKAEIKKARRVLELKSKDITGNSPESRVWPLIESNPGQARLVFPDDRFRMTKRAMEFVNADANAVDEALTSRYTQTLIQAGFQFPARSVHGRFTVLKPFEQGIFLVDQTHAVFHLKRVDGNPVVVKTPIDASLNTRHIKSSEDKRRQYYGLLLDGMGRVHLLSRDSYGLIPLDLPGYLPDTMDLKLIFNPLYCTAVYSNGEIIHAVAFDSAFKPLAKYDHAMSRATMTRARKIRDILFPFSLNLGTGSSGYLSLGLHWTPGLAVQGMAAWLGIYLLITLVLRNKKPGLIPSALAALLGPFGLLAHAWGGVDD
ncbi:MAG: DUF4857 domain-containing protein [Desulfobacterales bacterium]|nr:DUF4857 domain-containing protein [Desulfobacterales bacterium]